MAAKIQYIPGKVNSKTGNRIPWMTNVDEGAYLKAGIRARYFGLEVIKRNLNVVLGMVGINSLEGLTEFAWMLKEDMLITSPTIPEDTGKLKDSYFVTPLSFPNYNTGLPAVVEAGWGEDVPYALYVHEMTDDAYGKVINWSKEGSGAKFFQYALQRNAKRLLTEVGIKTKIGG